ncbi:hypothetical protein A3759_12260 [Thalassolituus sp. HI0120]|nr:hypothetical protein A3759_12260 [Thalassolituus sp. HI0120]
MKWGTHRIDIVAQGRGAKIIGDCPYEFEIERNYAELRLSCNGKAIFDGHYENYADFLGSLGKCFVEKRFQKGVKDVATDASGEMVFEVVGFDKFDKFNFRYSDQEVISLTDDFDNFIIRFYQWRFFRPLKLTMMYTGEPRNLQLMLSIAVYYWLRQDMTAHDG